MFGAILCILFVVGFFAVLFRGINDEIVIYDNQKDVLRVILTMVFYGLVLLCWRREATPDVLANFVVNWLFLPFCIFVTGVLVIDNFILCIRNNSGNIGLGILIAIYRYIYIILTPLIVFWVLHNGNKKPRGWGRLLADVAVAGVVAKTAILLINGDAVRAKRKRLIRK